MLATNDMRVKAFGIQNFRSLREVTLDGVGDIVILIGANSSGKSNILEALSLFFGQLDPAPSRNLGAVSDYIWFDRDPANPVIFNITLETTKAELMKIIPEQLATIVKADETNTVSVSRQITGKPQAATLVTKEVSANGKLIIKDGQLALTPEEVAAAAPLQATELVGRVLQGLSQLLQQSFVMIYAARNYVAPPARVGDRTQIIQPSITSELAQIGQSLDRPQIARWGEIEEFTKKVALTIEDLRVIAGQITVRESGTDERFPIPLVGGGHQELVTIMHQIGAGAKIFGIEEPEIHLHPELARRLFNAFKEISKDKQIFLATHSTVFVDHADLGNTWIVRREGRETTVTRVKESGDLKGLFYELGVRASDIFFSNGVIFVEGESDKVVFPILAEKLGIDFAEHELAVISTRGKSSGKYYLTLWTEIAKSTGIPYFMILDKDAENEAKKLSATVLTAGENLFILRKGSLEEYYPEERIVAAIKEVYGMDVSEEEKRKIVASPRDASIERFLRDKKVDTKAWKVSVGRHVAQQMSVDEINDELKRIIERIGTRLRIG
jgi:predicted ATP-dependent endonuclease of OLD family